MSTDAKSGESKRKHQRYAVSEDCRLKAAIKIQSSDADSANKDWPGTLVDVSSSGAHIQISMAAVAYKGDSCVLKLSHGSLKIEMRGVLAHYICSARYSVCGVKFDYPNAEEWQPFLKAILASSTLKVGDTGTEPGKYREEYVGPWLPEPVVDTAALAPDSHTELAEDLSIALLLTLDRLSPLERAAFLLQWAVIEHARERGLKRYDLGGIDPDANPDVYRFKGRMGGQEVERPAVWEKPAGLIAPRVIGVVEALRGLRAH